MSQAAAELPTVSVVIAARDAEKTIGRCLDSLAASSYPADRVEMIVVDNGSRDRTVAAVEAHRSRPRLLSERMRGSAPARNAGIGAASGDIVAFTDADCVVEADWLRLMVEALDRPEIAIACGEVRALEPVSEAESYGEVIHDTRRAIEVYTPPYAVTSNWASPRSVLLELGGFDEEMIRGQDTDLSYRAVSAGYRLVHVPGAIVRHRNERSLRALLRQGYRHGRYGRRIERKHRALLESYGYGRLQPPAAAVIWGHLRGSVLGERRGEELAAAVFKGGKRIGMRVGLMLERPPGRT